MLTQMSDADWEIVVEVFQAARSRRGDKGRDDRKFLEALHFFTVHNITWRALPAEFGNWNSVWKRFWRLSQRGVFEAMLAILAGMSGTAHLVQMVDSTIVRAHVSAAAQKGAGRASSRSLTRRLLHQNPPEVRFRWLTAGLSPDRRRGQRQPQLRDPARHRPGHHAESGARRQGLRRPGEPRGGAPARHLPRHPVPRECRRQTRFLSQDPLQRARPRRAGCRQAQALQTHPLTPRENRTELCRLHLACGHVYLGQIRPPGLTSPRTRMAAWLVV